MSARVMPGCRSGGGFARGAVIADRGRGLGGRPAQVLTPRSNCNIGRTANRVHFAPSYVPIQTRYVQTPYVKTRYVQPAAPYVYHVRPRSRTSLFHFPTPKIFFWKKGKHKVAVITPHKENFLVRIFKKLFGIH
jgi:hypothetical protein